jgi:hypothetical protein
MFEATSGRVRLKLMALRLVKVNATVKTAPSQITSRPNYCIVCQLRMA